MRNTSYRVSSRKGDARVIINHQKATEWQCRFLAEFKRKPTVSDLLNELEVYVDEYNKSPTTAAIPLK